MKVLMLVTYLNTGGTETYVLSLAKALRTQGIQVDIATTGGNYLWAFKRAGVKIHLIPKNTTSKNMAQRILRFIRTERYDLVHAHDSESFEAIGRHLRNKVQSVITIHGRFHTRDSITVASKIASKVIIVSEALRVWVRNIGVNPLKIILIPNGINVVQFSPAKNSNEIRQMLRISKIAHVVGYVGRFSEDKYSIAKTVMKAVSQIARNDKRYVAILQGAGIHTNQIKRFASRINNQIGRTVIVVLPPATNVTSTYHSSDIIVGTGRVAMEALACQKPVIGAGVAGYHGIVKPRNFNQAVKNQFGDHLATKKITQQILTNDILQLLNNPKYARLLGRFGRQQAVTHFSIKQIAIRITRVYTDVLSRK